jgi:hypothetical protein
MLNRVVLNKFAIGASIILSAGLALSVFAADPAKPKKEGYTDTPMEPGGKWHVHDPDRPNPRIITPAQSGTQDKAGTAPSDAIVLFDGKDTSHWQSTENGQAVAPKWKVEAGYMVAEKNAGSIFSKESFGDIQLHVEWSSPTPARGDGQGRGNSGVIIMRNYEIQVLDSYDNVTYADGQAGAIYGQYPPLANACRKPGEWQSYDIIFEAPKFDENKKLVKPAYVTVIHNGVLIHNRQEIMGAMAWRQLAKYSYHEPEMPLELQFHGSLVRYRNIWVRKIGQADQAAAEKKAE